MNKKKKEKVLDSASYQSICLFMAKVEATNDRECDLITIKRKRKLFWLLSFAIGLSGYGNDWEIGLWRRVADDYGDRNDDE